MQATCPTVRPLLPGVSGERFLQITNCRVKGCNHINVVFLFLLGSYVPVCEQRLGSLAKFRSFVRHQGFGGSYLPYLRFSEKKTNNYGLWAFVWKRFCVQKATEHVLDDEYVLFVTCGGSPSNVFARVLRRSSRQSGKVSKPCGIQVSCCNFRDKYSVALVPGALFPHVQRRSNSRVSYGMLRASRNLLRRDAAGQFSSSDTCSMRAT